MDFFLKVINKPWAHSSTSSKFKNSVPMDPAEETTTSRRKNVS